MPTCLDLRALAGERHWRWRQAAEASPSNRDPWLFEIPCRLGVIYPWGGDLLCLHVEEHNPTRTRLRALPGVESYQRGEAEEVFGFPVDRLDAVAEIAGPRRRRVLTPEQAAAGAERLARAREISPRSHVAGPETTLETIRTEIPGETASEPAIVDSGAAGGR